MATVNITIQVEERTKNDFDSFCQNMGINATAAVNLFITTVLRTRALPFAVYDVNDNDSVVREDMKRAIQSMQEQSVSIGNSKMTLDEINAEITAARAVAGIL